MHIPSQAPIHLLHRASDGTLATHTREPQGFPYSTALPFAPTATHAPMLLISRLAEHTRNLEADPRAGFLVAHAENGNLLEGQRLTAIGTFAPAPDDRQADLARRYLRYHPAAERYLALGDFAFWIMSIERIRFIGGFGAMGWIDAKDLDPLTPLSIAEESELLDFADAHSTRPANLELLGIDRYGCDLQFDGIRNRFTFDAPKSTAEALKGAMLDCFARHG
ncbi:putative heme iron utilization protein [Candidatus Burkholderia verschuerenii]|uniref:Putative heme iron utilization protein n=1 Tax=Candidatus Burkholderia verschuerenii TaxID=242163 RepID=A0A0L0M4F9_9BURK|nr:pyridoxamine 5'-phosphate oxidase family protein [Candidatus Burkholderia verschuerenii]KND57171.1 putative heme iron utilization protein [Candidatus Burkholderia verschuerenii]